jgi:hypothetical protein
MADYDSYNPYIGATTTYDPENQTYVQVFDDGSTLATDVEGNVVSTGTSFDYDPDTDYSNPYIGPTTTYNPDTQTYVQVFDDGSTLETDVEGNVVSTTNATDGTSLADSISRLFGSIGANAGKLLTSMFKKSDGSGETDWKKVATLGGGLMGLLGSGGGGSRPSGYQGSIPQYTATRTQLPMTDTDRVPGSAGRRYFSDLTYAPVTPPAATPAAPAATPTAPTETTPTNRTQSESDTTNTAAQGGLMQLAKGRYLRGHTDGMEDKLRTTIDGKDPAALSHGEFVIPADVVSHLGNGNSDAGAKRLYQMMDRIRQARTGTKQQGKQIQANKYLPA